MAQESDAPNPQRAVLWCLVTAWGLTAVGALLPFPYLGLLAIPALPVAAGLLYAHAELRRSPESKHPILGIGLAVVGQWLLLATAVSIALQHATMFESARRGHLLTDTPRVLIGIALVWIVGTALAAVGLAIAASRSVDEMLLPALGYAATLPASWLIVGALAPVWPLTN